ncbi:MAG: calcium-binding protein, partial [Pseudomonadota bacterium]
EAWQTLLHAQTGRGVISLSETDDTFDFLDMNDRAADAGDGNDVISGSMLADIIVGGEGQDSLDGGAGDDIIVGDGVDPQMLLDWLDGSDFIFG